MKSLRRVRHTTTASSDDTPSSSETTTVVRYNFTVETKTLKFYFSHDEEEFKAEDLIESVTRYAVYSDGSVSKNAETLSTLDGVSFNGVSPSMIYTEGRYQYLITVGITDEFGTQNIEQACSVYVGVKGDANLDGSADAIDAAVILVYAAASGAGKEAYFYSDTDAEAETFAYFLANVNGTASADSPVDATDAAAVLVYAAASGSGKDITWDEVLGTA